MTGVQTCALPILLKANDACFIGPNESREIVNRGNEVVTMLVAVSTPQK